jgi:3-phytase/alkaline phosphatase D
MTRHPAVSLAAAVLAALLTQPLRAAELPHGVAAGDVTAVSAVLWARGDVAGRLSFELSPRTDLRGARRILRSVADPEVPAKAFVAGLRPGTTYHYRATDAEGNSSRGRFRTAPAACDGGSLRFGVSGDWRGELGPYPSIRNIPARDLDFFVKHGDTIYAENYSLPGTPTAQTLPEYRAKHQEVLSERFGLNAWKDARASAAILATIDDHEVINDFAGGAAPISDPRVDNSGDFINETERYRTGLRAFEEYMPIRAERYGDTGDPRTARKIKLYRSRYYGSVVMVAVLDARSFRDAALPPVANLADPAQVGAFPAASFDPTRTMLGTRQFEDLKADLLRAKRLGVTWKFVMVPEPVQNLGVLAASDRYEGYAAERSALLAFIEDNDIDNVVFVAADIHGTLTNNLSFQPAAFGPQLASRSWEVSTGAVAFDAPLGPTIVDLAAGVGLLTPAQRTFYDALPVANDADAIPNDKDDFVRSLIDTQLAPLGYDALGLGGSTVPATLVEGDYVAGHSYGWTEFEVDAATQALTVTTWGVSPYTFADLASRGPEIAARTPTVVSRFKVEAAAVPAGICGRIGKGPAHRH